MGLIHKLLQRTHFSFFVTDQRKELGKVMKVNCWPIYLAHRYASKWEPIGRPTTLLVLSMSSRPMGLYRLGNITYQILYLIGSRISTRNKGVLSGNSPLGSRNTLEIWGKKGGRWGWIHSRFWQSGKTRAPPRTRPTSHAPLLRLTKQLGSRAHADN